MNENKKIEELFKQNKREYADVVFEQRITDMIPARPTYAREILFMVVIFITFGLFVSFAGLYDVVVAWVGSVFAVVSTVTSNSTVAGFANVIFFLGRQLQSLCNLHSLMMLLVIATVIFGSVVTYRGVIYGDR
ncbi:MAG: DUF5056 domain-containing protein [bacterium]